MNNNVNIHYALTDGNQAVVTKEVKIPGPDIFLVTAIHESMKVKSDVANVLHANIIKNVGCSEDEADELLGSLLPDPKQGIVNNITMIRGEKL